MTATIEKAKKRGTYRPAKHGGTGRDGASGRGRKRTQAPPPETPVDVLIVPKSTGRIRSNRAAISRELKALDRLLNDGRAKSRLETLCILRQIHDLEHGANRGLYWDAAEADRIERFFGTLRHWKGKFAGSPLTLEPWQRLLWVRPLFGWMLDRPRSHGGLRRFRIGHAETARKNGKSFIGAGVALQGLLADAEAGPECYTAATTRDQANIIFRDSKRVLGPELRPEIVPFKFHLDSPRNDGVLRPLSGDYGSMDGLNPSRIVYDELHAAQTRDLWDVLTSAFGSRQHPLLLAVTTAGFNRAGICFEQRRSLIKTLKGVERGEWINDALFGLITTIDDDDDWEDPTVWGKANPNLGISLFDDYLRTQHRQAIGSKPAENNFRTKHLNQWTASAVRWLDMRRWDACDGYESIDDREKRLAGRDCFGALDLGEVRDVCALVLLFPDGDQFEALPYFFCPEDSLSDRARQDRLQVIQWADQGFIRKTPGNETDFSFVREEEVKRLSSRFRIRKLAFDPWHAADMIQQLQSQQRFPASALVKFGQGGFGNWALPTKRLEELVIAGAEARRAPRAAVDG